jgi:putative hydrolase of the HAD superfamily
MQAIIFDLDDTLIPETTSLRRALLETAGQARKRFGIDPSALAQAVLRHAGELWTSAPTAAYCDRLGISPWEGLTSVFSHYGGEDTDSDRAYLREWASTYRQQTWKLALDDFNAGDWMAACDLAEHFRGARFDTHVPGEYAEALLDSLCEEGYRLALLSNGPTDLQNEKLTKTGLKRHFDPELVFISGQLSIGKPDPDLFQLVLERLGVEPREAVMVGDNPNRDIHPALAAGLQAIWMRNGRNDDLVPGSIPRVDTLAELPALISSLLKTTA